MRFPRSGIRSTALLLVCLMAAGPLPTIGAAGPIAADPVGSLTSAGPVRLRGVPVAGEGTVFSGDTIDTAPDGWATLSLAQGQRVELAGATGVEVSAAGDGIRLAMRSGHLAFASPGSGAPVSLDLEDYRIVPGPAAVVEVAFLDPDDQREDAIGVRALAGGLRIESADGEAYTVPPGGSRVLSLGGRPGPPEPAAPRQFGPESQVIWTLAGAGAVTGVLLYFLLRENIPSPDTP